MQGNEAAIVASEDIGAHGNQMLHGLSAAISGSKMQWGRPPARGVSGVDVVGVHHGPDFGEVTTFASLEELT